MDQIKLNVLQVDDARENVVQILINGSDLIDLAREHERPFAEKEGHGALAGLYTNISLRVLSPPSRHLFGTPEDSQYAYRGKVEILSCADCGGSWCWPLSSNIAIEENTVIWKDFVQPHRDDPKVNVVWSYTDFGPFVFCRNLYEIEVESLADWQ